MPSSACQKCARSEEHTSELQSHSHLVCRLLLAKKEHTSELQSHSHLVSRPLLEDTRPRCPAARLANHTPTTGMAPGAVCVALLFFFKDPAPPDISPFPLHDPLPL